MVSPIAKMDPTKMIVNRTYFKNILPEKNYFFILAERCAFAR